jgi:hypothetical protein
MLTTFPQDTIPENQDTLELTQKKALAILNNAATGAVPLVVTGGGGGDSGQPYGAAQAAITNVAAGPSVIVYKDSSGATLKTRTFTYTNSGASSTDVLTGWADT